MSSGKKNNVDQLCFQRDEQFQVQNIADDSSSNSSRRGQYQIARYDDSEQQNQKATSVKSLQQINSPVQVISVCNHKIDAQNSQNIYKETEIKKMQHVDIEQSHKSQDQKQKQIQNTQNQQKYFQSSLENKKRKRIKIFQKIKHSSNQKPKTKITSMKSKQFSAQQIQANKQQSTLNRVAFEKKRQNHSLLKSWNYRRLNRLQFHRSIADQLIKNIDKNIKTSFQIFETFHAFYIQRCRQQQIRLNYNFHISEQNFQQNQTSQNVYIANSIILKNLVKREKNQKEIVLNFINYIQSKIIKDIFQHYLNKTHKQFINLKQQVALVKQALQKIEQSTCKKLIRLQTYFSQSCQSVTEQRQTDFYRAEMSFLSKCQAQVMMENKFARLILDYYLLAIQQQKKRKQLIEQSLLLYKEALKKYHKYVEQSRNSQNQTHKYATTQQLDDKRNGQIDSGKYILQIKQLYKMQNLLQPQTIYEIQEKIAIQQPQNQQTNLQAQKQYKEDHQTTEHTQDIKKLRYEQFQFFFSNYQFEQFDCHHLIMKKFQVEVLKQGKWIPGSIIITIDKFVHIFASAKHLNGVLVFGSQIYYKPEFTLKIHFIKLELPKNQKLDEYEISTDDELQIVISTKKQKTNLQKIASLIKTNDVSQQTVRFSKQNDLIEFQDYIEELST